MIFDMPTCGACKTCEIACSFHHTGEFKPSVSSIKIVSKRCDAGFHVVLIEKDDGELKGCDFCSGLDVPMCMEYCKESEALSEFLEALRDRTKKE